MILALYLLNNKIVVGVCGTILTYLIIYTIYNVIRSKNIPVTTKRAVWFFFLILFSVVYATCSKLF